jgi:ABC-type glycerol-3-phosphate transport system permease component
MRQFFLQIPRDLDEAAIIDGANSWQVLWHILLPLAQPALATVAIFSFLTHWNDFFHPLIYLSTVESFPLSVGLRWFQQAANDPSEPREHLLMAASMLMVLPCVLIFFTMQRYFVRGIVMSGIKG